MTSRAKALRAAVAVVVTVSFVFLLWESYDYYRLSRDNNNSSYCNEFFQRPKYRMYPYYIGRVYTSAEPGDVTLVVHLSYDRLFMLRRLLTNWDGPISIALYVSEEESYKLGEIFSDFSQEQMAKIAVHTVYKTGELYPFNYLRNVAWEFSTTPYVFLNDADLIPVPSMYVRMRSFLQSSSTSTKVAYVVPAFETLHSDLPFPTSKPALLTLIRKKVFPFKYQNFQPGHKPTDYTKWVNATAPYEVNWHEHYEPYIVVAHGVTRYSEKFAGYGRDKVSQIEELHAQRFSFVVLPNDFVIHYPHKASQDEARFRGYPVDEARNRNQKSTQYEKCIKAVYSSFRRYLKFMYDYP